MTTKTYTVRFYCGASATGVEANNVSRILATLTARPLLGLPYPTWEVGNIKYRLMVLDDLNGGAVFKGVLGVLRDEAPHILESTGSEREIQLAEGEHLVEKNHFLYFREHEILVWQINKVASHVVRLEHYLSHCHGQTIVLQDVITAQALERIQHGIVKRIEFRIAKPTNAALIDEGTWESHAMNLLNGAGGGTISVSIGTKSRRLGLLSTIKEAAHRLLDKPETRALRVKMGGETEPIDLMAERVKDKMEVEMNGIYPDADDIFTELQACKDRQQPALDAIFGVGDGVLE